MKKYNLIPLILLVWLFVMAIGFGVPSIKNGTMTLTEFSALFVVTLLCIILLRWNMKKHPRKKR